MSEYKGYTKAQSKATTKYQKENLDQIAIRIPKGNRIKYKMLAKAEGKPLAKLITDLMDKEIKDKGLTEYIEKEIEKEQMKDQEGGNFSEN